MKGLAFHANQQQSISDHDADSEMGTLSHALTNTCAPVRHTLDMSGIQGGSQKYQW